MVKLHVFLSSARTEYLLYRRLGDFWSPSGPEDENKISASGNSNPNPLHEGTAVAQWLRCCATNRKVAGSIPDGVIGIFH